MRLPFSDLTFGWHNAAFFVLSVVSGLYVGSRRLDASLRQVIWNGVPGWLRGGWFQGDGSVASVYCGKNNITVLVFLVTTFVSICTKIIILSSFRGQVLEVLSRLCCVGIMAHSVQVVLKPMVNNLLWFVS
jgi:hypothetical protein